MCYIEGGAPRGSQIVNLGSRDKTPPRDDRPILLDWELYFAGYSSWWNGASAFIRKARLKARTLGRMYLISDDQFNDVVIQENGLKADGRRVVPTFERLVHSDDSILKGIRMYGRLVHVGEQNGQPILTFTSTKDDPRIAAPSERYLKMIVRGIRETYPAMNDTEISAYFENLDGVRGLVELNHLKRWIGEAGNSNL